MMLWLCRDITEKSLTGTLKHKQKKNILIFFTIFRWIHDYQDACVDKLERFLRGEKKGILHASSQEDSSPYGPPHGSDPVVKQKKGHMFGLGSSFEECL